jgi:hypothetical protein
VLELQIGDAAMGLSLVLALLALQPMPPAASAPPAQTQATAAAPADAKTGDDRAERAATLIKDGKPAEAIAILDPMIAEFEKAHPANPDLMVFSASNPTQTLWPQPPH